MQLWIPESWVPRIQGRWKLVSHTLWHIWCKQLATLSCDGVHVALLLTLQKNCHLISHPATNRISRSRSSLKLLRSSLVRGRYFASAIVAHNVEYSVLWCTRNWVSIFFSLVSCLFIFGLCSSTKPWTDTHVLWSSESSAPSGITRSLARALETLFAYTLAYLM